MDKRLPDEPFEDYKARLKVQRAMIKAHLRGTKTWDSSRVGTYRKKDLEKKDDPPVL